MQHPISLAKTIPEPAAPPAPPSPSMLASPWVGGVYAFALGACLAGAFGVASSGAWTPPWDTPSTFVPPERAKQPPAPRRTDSAVSHDPSRSLDRRAIERELQSLTPEQRAAVEAAMAAGARNERATRSDTPPPGSERLDGDMALGVNGWGDRLDEDRSVDGPTVAQTLALPPPQDEPPIVDTSVPPSAAQIREGTARFLEDAYRMAHPDEPVPPMGLVDGWIDAHPLSVPLSYGAPDAWSTRTAFGVDSTVEPPVFILPDGMVWHESAPGFWDIEGNIRPALGEPRVWGIHDRGRSGYVVVQMALVDGRLRLVASELGRSGMEERGWPVQEVPVVGWSPLFQDGKTTAQTVLVSPGGPWLVRVTSPISGASAFVRFDPEGRTSPETTGVLFQEFGAAQALSSTWAAPEEALEHLPSMVMALWDLPVARPDAGSPGEVAFARGTPTSLDWSLGAGTLAADGIVWPESGGLTGNPAVPFAPEHTEGRVPAIAALPGTAAIAMWLPLDASDPWAWVVGVTQDQVMGASPFTVPQKWPFTIPSTLGLGAIAHIEHAYAWPDGAVLLKAALVDGRWVNLLWHMPSGAVTVLER